MGGIKPAEDLQLMASLSEPPCCQRCWEATTGKGCGTQQNLPYGEVMAASKTHEASLHHLGPEHEMEKFVFLFEKCLPVERRVNAIPQHLLERYLTGCKKATHTPEGVFGTPEKARVQQQADPLSLIASPHKAQKRLFSEADDGGEAHAGASPIIGQGGRSSSLQVAPALDGPAALSAPEAPATDIDPMVSGATESSQDPGHRQRQLRNDVVSPSKKAKLLPTTVEQDEEAPSRTSPSVVEGQPQDQVAAGFISPGKKQKMTLLKADDDGEAPAGTPPSVGTTPPAPDLSPFLPTASPAPYTPPAHSGFTAPWGHPSPQGSPAPGAPPAHSGFPAPGGHPSPARSTAPSDRGAREMSTSRSRDGLNLIAGADDPLPSAAVAVPAQGVAVLERYMPTDSIMPRCGMCAVGKKGGCGYYDPPHGNRYCSVLALQKDANVVSDMDVLFPPTDARGRILYQFLLLHKENKVAVEFPKVVYDQYLQDGGTTGASRAAIDSLMPHWTQITPDLQEEVLGDARKGKMPVTPRPRKRQPAWRPLQRSKTRGRAPASPVGRAPPAAALAPELAVAPEAGPQEWQGRRGRSVPNRHPRRGVSRRSHAARLKALAAGVAPEIGVARDIAVAPEDGPQGWQARRVRSAPNRGRGKSPGRRAASQDAPINHGCSRGRSPTPRRSTPPDPTPAVPTVPQQAAAPAQRRAPPVTPRAAGPGSDAPAPTVADPTSGSSQQVGLLHQQQQDQQQEQQQAQQLQPQQQQQQTANINRRKGNPVRSPWA